MSKKKAEELSPEEQLEAVERYRKALGTHKPRSEEDLTNLRKHKPAAETLEKFDFVLQQLFAPDVSWEGIPTWALRTLYEEVQDRDDPYAYKWTNFDLKRHVRIWLVRNKKDWIERTFTTGGRPRIIFPNGRSLTITGFFRKHIWHVAVDKTFPPKFGYNKPALPSQTHYLYQLNRKQVLDAFEKAGFKFR